MSLPLVSCVIAAYDYGRYLPRALDSALGQDYPADRLEIVVVDDGSTDDTPEVLARYAAAHPDRITAVRQENAGFIAATHHALGLVRGDLIAILDADDEWFPDKTRRQVELFRADPRLGLVYGDMTLTDADGAVLEPSMFAAHASRPQRGRVLGTLIGRNFVPATTIMLRADLLDVVLPLPPEAEVPCQDWWIAAQVSRVADVDFLPEPCALYRRHGENMTGADVVGQGETVNMRRHVRQVRSLLARVEPGEVAPADLAAAVGEIEACAAVVVAAEGSWFALAAEVSDAERAAAERELAVDGTPVQRLFAAARAVGRDPESEPARARLAELLARFPADPDAVVRAALAAHPTRPLRLLADADELLAEPALCETLAAVGAGEPVTVAVAIDAERFDALVAPLRELLGAHGLDGDDGPDLLAFPCPPLVAQQLAPGTVDGLLTAEPARGALPCFGPGDGEALLALAASVAAQPV